LKIIIVYLLIILMIITLCLKAVGKKEVFIVERCGKFYKELSYGLYFLFPLIDKIVKKIPLTEEILKFRYNNKLYKVGYSIIDNKKYTYATKKPLKKIKKYIIDKYQHNNNIDVYNFNEAIEYIGIKLIDIEIT